MRSQDFSLCGFIAVLLGVFTLWIPSASGDDKELTFKQARSLEKQGGKPIDYSLVFSPDGTKALSSDDRPKQIYLWDLGTGKLLHRFEVPPFTSLMFSSNGQQFMTAGDGRITLWDVASRKEVLHFDSPRKEPMVILAPNDKLVLLCGYEQAWLWDATTGKERRPLQGKDYKFGRPIFSRDGRRILASIRTGDHYVIGVWEVETGKEVRRLDGKFDKWIELAATASGKHAVAYCHDQTIRTWEIESGRQIKSVRVPTKKDMSVRIVLSKDGRRAVAMERKVKTDWVARRIDLGGGRFQIISTKQEVPVGDPTFYLWDIETGTLCGSEAVKGATGGIALSADGRLLLLGSKEGDLRLWELTKSVRTAPK